MSSLLVEICVDGVDGLAAAMEGGADRIELCSALETGGLTPSAALVAAAAAARAVPIHAMVRPRGGDFLYSAAEAALMVDEVKRLADAGMSGVVVGAIDGRGLLDVALLSRLRAAATGIAMTLHRAIDLLADPVEGVRVAAELGCSHVLTSGGAPTAMEGRRLITAMVEAAPPSLTVIAGAGISPAIAATLIKETRVTQIHASASRMVRLPGTRGEALGFGAASRRVTDANSVRALKAAVSESR